MKKPNKETIEAMEELKNGKGVKFNSVDELFKITETLEEKENLEFIEKINNARKSPKVKVSASEQAKILGIEEKEDLGLFFLMEKSDKNDVVTRDEIMKILEQKK